MEVARPTGPHTWVFDVDGTLVDSLTGTSLRPGALALLERIRTAGATVRLWSAGGAEYARRRAASTGIGHLVDSYHDKDGRDADGRYTTAHLLLALDDVVFVDDRPGDLPLGADVIIVSPYLAPNEHDRGLERALARAR
ncbi:MAG: HAD family hydrolase [Ilumatobacteraceae bacterium]